MYRCLILILLLPHLLTADELRFRDGSVIVGNFISVDSGFYVFDTPLLGRIFVRTADAELVRMDAPVGLPGTPIVRLTHPEQAVTVPVETPLPTVLTEPSEVHPLPVVQAQRTTEEAIAEAKDVSILYRILAYVNPLRG